MDGFRNNEIKKLFYKLADPQVARLYRDSLKLLSSWCIDRDIFNEESTKIRSAFDEERGCKPEKAIRLLRQGQEKLWEYTHPDPYRNPIMPGGSKFMRNPPIPIDVCFPDGNYPADVPKYEIEPDWSKSDPAEKGYTLIDYGKKSME
jgi:NADH dehydrogenase (ubiquinone) 1 beta subcomplex subunit 9